METADEMMTRWERETREQSERERDWLRISITLSPLAVSKIMSLHADALSRGAVSMDELVVKLWVDDVVRKELWGEGKG